VRSGQMTRIGGGGVVVGCCFWGVVCMTGTQLDGLESLFFGALHQAVQRRVFLVFFLGCGWFVLFFGGSLGGVEG
jgi:hypothetical protein